MDSRRYPPHLMVAGGIAVIATLIALGPLTSTGGSYPIPTDQLRVPLGSNQGVMPAKRATAPLVPEYATSAVRNPFTLDHSVGAVVVKVPFPPPPPLMPPPPPVLPLPEK